MNLLLADYRDFPHLAAHEVAEMFAAFAVKDVVGLVGAAEEGVGEGGELALGHRDVAGLSIQRRLSMAAKEDIKAALHATPWFRDQGRVPPIPKAPK